ncbi:MAG: phage minor head protein [Pseudomonadota bacterium]
MSAPAFVMQPLHFKEAIDAFQGRLPLTPDQFARLGAEARAKAFTMAGVYREDMLAEVYGALNKALSEGTTFADFKRAAQDIWGQRGMAGPNPWHLQTVFQTNLQTSYQAGRYRQMSETVARRPYWQYMAVMDGRTRPSHAALHGQVWPAIHPVWNSIYPPNGFNCRCAVVSLSQDEMDEEGLTAQQRPPDMQPDPGWDYNPGRAHWGEGHINRVLGQSLEPGGWKPLDKLLEAMDAPPKTMPAPAPLPAELPPRADDLLRQVGGSQDAARAYYQGHAQAAIGFLLQDGLPQPVDLVDARGDGCLLSPRMLDHVTAKKEDLERARYLGLARDVIQNADEIWLIPGIYPDGRVTMRRRYLKIYQDDTEVRTLMTVAELSRGVWDGFNAMPLKIRTFRQQRKGLLLLGGGSRV